MFGFRVRSGHRAICSSIVLLVDIEGGGEKNALTAAYRTLDLVRRLHSFRAVDDGGAKGARWWRAGG